MRMSGYLIQRLYIAFCPKFAVKSCLVPLTTQISIGRSLNVSGKRWNLDQTSVQDDPEKGGQDYSFNEAHPYLEVYPRLTKEGVLNEEFIRDLVVNVVGCSEETAKKLYDEYPQLKDIHAVTFIETFQHFKEKGVERSTVLNNFELLFHSFTSIKRKFGLISRIGVNEDTVALMKLSLNQLENVVKGWDINETVNGVTYTNRLDYVRSSTGCNMQQLIKHPNILSGQFNQIKEKLQLLHEHGLTREDISQSMRIFRLGQDKIEYRLKKATFANIGPLKCWMLTCSNEKFEDIISDWKGLGEGLTKDDDDLESYLMKRLECSKDYLEYLKYREPRLLKRHVQQVKLALDFIFSLGFTASDVCNSPKFITTGVDRLKSGYARLTALGLKPTHLSHLAMKETDFKSFVENQQQHTQVNDTNSENK